MPADISFSSGTEQGIAEAMNENIGIGMAFQPTVMINCHAAQDQRPPLDQSMNIVSLSNPDHEFSCFCM
jgi:hypothetical protein